MAAAGAFCVVHVDGAAPDGGQRLLQEAALVQRVGVELDLKIHLVGNVEAGVDRRRHGAPVLVDLEAHAAARDLIDQRVRLGRVAPPEEAEVDRPGFRRLQHLADVPGAAAVDADGDRPERAAQHRRDPARDRVLAELRAVEVNVDVDAARRRDQPLRIADRGRSAAEQRGVHPVHHRRVAGLADAGDEALLDADIALDDTQDWIDDDGVGDQHVERARCAVEPGDEADAVPQSLAAAVQALLAQHAVVVLDLGQELAVAETHAVAGRGPVERRVLRPAHPCHRSSPLEAAGAGTGQRLLLDAV